MMILWRTEQLLGLLLQSDTGSAMEMDCSIRKSRALAMLTGSTGEQLHALLCGGEDQCALSGSLMTESSGSVLIPYLCFLTSADRKKRDGT